MTMEQSALARKMEEHRQLQEIRDQKCQEQFGKCYWCGVIMATSTGQFDNAPNLLTADHLLPKVRGGSPLDPANIVAACLTCNGRKGLSPWWEFAKQPIATPVIATTPTQE